jgi:hypothetical protein
MWGRQFWRQPPFLGGSLHPGSRLYFQSMADAVVEALILDLLDWLAAREPTYEQVMDAWRTSCPKLPVSEEANDRGLVTREEVNGRSIVAITSSGRALLRQRTKAGQI